MIYTVTFNPALDYVVRMDELALGQVNRTVSEDVQLGGKGINVSWVLRELGHENVALGFVAGFTGKAIEDGLAAKGVATDFIHLPAGLTRINVKLKAGEETEINGKGPDISAEALEELYHKLDALSEGDVLVLAGSIPASMPSDVYESILARLEGKKVLCAVDATRDLLVNVLKYRPFVIKPNNHELGEIFGRTLTTDEEIRECAAKLQEQGARNVLVSMAGDGAMLLDENGVCHRLAAHKGRVKNSVGAGDSMVAGFLSKITTGEDYETALIFGSACGTATAASKGIAKRSTIDRVVMALYKKMGRGVPGTIARDIQANKDREEAREAAEAEASAGEKDA